MLRRAIDNLLLYDPDHQDYASKYKDEVGSNCDVYKVNSLNDLKTAVAEFTNVRYLEIVFHGTAGSNLRFGDGSGIAGSLFSRTLTENPVFINPNSRVLFYSCNIGEGTVGDNFMDHFGKTVFAGRGGILGATTVVNRVLFRNTVFATNIFMVPGLDGKLKVRRYDQNGTRKSERIVNKYGKLQ